ncbi:MAG: hypothetical protein P4M00_03745 [Azospirillaceae bacterium]|nr:hypothetical protein [Azospirillaceae bacterium]
MTLDPQSAASSLVEVSRIEQRTREALRYGGASAYLFLWGGLTTIGYVAEFFEPTAALTRWHLIMALGVGGSFAIRTLRNRDGRTGTASANRRMLYAQIALLAFGGLWTQLFGSFNGPGLDAFWPTLFMSGFVIAGFWLGRFFIAVGVIVTALTVAGFLWSGPLFPLWMAVVNGGGLIAGGLWVRRLGIAP